MLSRSCPSLYCSRRARTADDERLLGGNTMANLNAGVLFDVDGTLFDTNYLHALAWSRAFRDAGEWAPMNAIHRLIGRDGEELVIELIGHESPRASEKRPVR